MARHVLPATLVACMLAWPVSALAQSPEAAAPAEGRLELSPPVLQLDEGPGPLRLMAVDLPPFSALVVEVRYDPEMSRVTALGLGSMVAGSGAGQEALTLRETSPGRLRFEIRPRREDPAEDLGDAEDEEAGTRDEGSDGATDEDPIDSSGQDSAALLPQGSGELAVITFSALSSAEEPSDVEIEWVDLLDADDAPIIIESGTAQIAVAIDPEASAREATLEQANAMAELVVAVGPLDGIRNNLGKAYRGLRGRLVGAEGPDPTVVWIGIFLLACLMVAAGWHVGRQPLPSSEEPGASGYSDPPSG